MSKGPRDEHPIEKIRLKPCTTVKKFAADLKERIERAATAFDDGGNEAAFMAGIRYVSALVDAATSDYDVRDVDDWERMAGGHGKVTSLDRSVYVSTVARLEEALSIARADLSRAIATSRKAPGRP